MSAPALRDPQDLAQLAERGIAPAEAERQLASMASPAHWSVLERPCTIGDGIERLAPERVETLLARHAIAAAAGRVRAFVPASGAASRMFKDLVAAAELSGPLEPARVLADGSPAARALARYVDALPRFAFAGAIERSLAARGHALAALRDHGPWRPLLEVLLGPEGLDAARAPKGLLAFHRERGEVRTAFEEHLVETCAWASDAHAVRRLELTVSPEHRAGFASLLAAQREALAARHGGTWDVRFTEQHPDTDTLAGDPAGGPFRDERGRLLFRPAGHGALLRNLAESGGDLVFVKNIDNVAVARVRPEGERWCRVLLGLADEIAHEVRDRPVRVCGMVANTGEPGGGPFWVRSASGASPQIVESAQVDLANAAQAAVFRAATHFNPVFMAVALRDAQGKPHDLARFVDESAVIVTHKSHGGRELLALERPGLWNGGMAHWHTRFVEVPLAVFNPVKTVFDLLRPEHQGD